MVRTKLADEHKSAISTDDIDIITENIFKGTVSPAEQCD
jgi:hypothetical protein